MPSPPPVPALSPKEGHMHHPDLYRLLWSVALLTAIVTLYLCGAPHLLLGALLAQFPRDLHSGRRAGGALATRWC
jgi:hypothetical protein